MDREDASKSRGFAFVTLSTLEAATKAVAEMNGQELDGRTIKVDHAEEKGGGPGGGGAGPGGQGLLRVRLFIGGLSFNTSEFSLQKVFEDYNVLECKVMMKDDDDSKSRGFGFVTVGTADDAARAVIDLNGKELDGRNIKVDVAANKTGGGGGGGGGEGSGGGARGPARSGSNAVPLGGGDGGGGGANNESSDGAYGRREGDDEGGSPAIDKQERNFETSGLLAEETNTVNGVVVVYAEPVEARKPKALWRLYEFKGDEQTKILHIHRNSAYLIGKEHKVCDIPMDHPSISKQ
jgi:RNA recognition motif-containing protein